MKSESKKAVTLGTQKDLFAIQKTILRLFGFSIDDEEYGILYNIYSILALAFSVSFPTTLYIFSVFNNSDTASRIESIAYATACTSNIIKVLTVLRIRKKFANALRLLYSPVFRPDKNRGGEKEENLFKECQFLISIQAKFMLWLLVGSVLNSFVRTLYVGIYSNYWMLPYGGFPFLNSTVSPNYEIIWIYQAASILYVGAATILLCTVFSGVMLFISYQCKILQNFITVTLQRNSEYMEKMENDKGKNLLQKYMSHKLEEIVAYHSDIIKLAEHLDDLINGAALVDFVGNALVICTSLFYVTIFPNFNLRTLNQFISCLANTGLQLISSYWGHEVIIQSTSIANSCYDENLCDFGIRNQKSWILIMQRSQKPICFTVGKYAPLSLNTFLKITQSSYSYLMMLYNLSVRK